MRNLCMILVRVSVAILILSSLLPGQNGQRQGRGRGNAPSSPTANLPFDPHDLSGFWSRNPRNGGGGTCPTCGDLGFNKDVPPMTAWGQAKFNANKPSYGRELGSPLNGEHIGRVRGIPPGQGNDIVTACNPEGLTRALIQPNPMEIVQIPGRMFQFFEWNYQRREIWTDGRPLAKEHDLPRWFGYSVGKWEGDTFVVDSNGFDERTWVDHFGYPHSDEMHLQERYRRVDLKTIELVMKLEDPAIYTKPWVSEKLILKLQPQQEIEEGYCVGSEWETFNQRMRDPANGKK